MDYSAFLFKLPTLYHNWRQANVYSTSSALEKIAQQVRGTTTTNVMQLLNLAVGELLPGEVYCEIGCFQGQSLIAALDGQSEQMAYAVDSFAAMNLRGQNAEKLAENLAKFNLSDRVFVCAQAFADFFAELGSLELEDRIGVLFYDAAQDYDSLLLALSLAKPFLADQAVLVVNGSNYQFAQQAIQDFLAATPEAQLLLNLPEFKHEVYSFLDGVCVLAWDYQQSKDITPEQSAVLDYQPVNQTKADCLNLLLAQAAEAKQQGQNQLAIAKYQAFLLWQVDHFQAWLNLGVLYLESQQYFEALEALTNAQEIDDTNALVHFNLGLSFEHCGDLHHAALAYRTAIACNRELTEACNNLGAILLSQGEPTEAEKCFEKAIAAKADDYAGHFNLGHALLARAKIPEAIAAYEVAQQLQPDNQDIKSTLDKAIADQKNPINLYLECGSLAYDNDKHAEAVGYLLKVLELDDGHPHASNTLADCYSILDQEAKAISVLEHSLEIYPDLGNQIALVLMLRYYGHDDRAIALLKKSQLTFPNALALKLAEQLYIPLFYETHQEMLQYRQAFTEGLASLLSTLPQQIQVDQTSHELNSNLIFQTFESNQFYLAYQGCNDLELQCHYGQLVQQLLANKFSEFMQPRPMPSVSGKIRIGYVAGSMRFSALGELYIGWLRHCTRADFEIYCYYTGHKLDYSTQEFRQLSDHFYHLPDDVLGVCQQATADRLHILVFPGIGLETTTLMLAGLRLAPIQCTSWCHPVTTGLTTIDYFLSCESMETDQAESHYSEKLVCLPKIGISFPKPKIAPPVKNRADFGIPEQAIAYLSCQTSYKYQPQHDFIYPAIAQQVQQAKFIFLNNPSPCLRDKFINRLKGAFAEYNLNSEDYCIFLPRIPEQGYLALNQAADIFLDTFGWSGGVTTLKAIACDLPIVTCPGPMMRSRHSYGILKTLGVTDTIAETEQNYIDIAVRLALDLEWRQNIINRMQQGHDDLYDDKTCVIGLEQFYRHIVNSASPIREQSY
jgi:protein O-GlcNAc transferase